MVPEPLGAHSLAATCSHASPREGNGDLMEIQRDYCGGAQPIQVEGQGTAALKMHPPIGGWAEHFLSFLASCRQGAWRALLAATRTDGVVERLC